MRDMSTQEVRPSFVLQLFDTFFLLRSSGSTLDWHGLVAMLDIERAAASVHLLLSYLAARGWYTDAALILPLLAAKQSLLDPHGNSLGKWLRVPWSLVFPPSLSGRYHPRFHWARITRRWKRRTQARQDP